ncbi:MAG: sulfite exporter TauE/SafE family protein [Ruminococcaceae bacterium]|nr:sulfite exporter TauE/SafE family protein [Oscillospiraceae bacterium]
MIITIIAGFLSGIISGMGVGGGAVLIPALTFFLGVNQHVAQCTNLYYFIPTAIVALLVHIKNKNIMFKTAVPLIIFGILGSVIGSFVAVNISTKVLRKIFAVFLFSMGINQLFTKNKT